MLFLAPFTADFNFYLSNGMVMEMHLEKAQLFQFTNGVYKIEYKKPKDKRWELLKILKERSQNASKE